MLATTAAIGEHLRRSKPAQRSPAPYGSSTTQHRRTHHRPIPAPRSDSPDQPAPSLPGHALHSVSPEPCRRNGDIRRARRTDRPTRERTTLHHTETEIHMKTTRTRRARSLLAVPALATTAALVLAGCGARAGDDTPAAEAAPPQPRAASTPPATRSSSASSTRSPAAWRSPRRPSPTCCTWPPTRSTPTAASSARRSSTSRKTAPPTGRPSRRRPRSCSPRTASPRSSAAGPRPPARPSSRSSRRTTASSSTRCSTRASRRRRTSTTPVRPPTSRSSRRWTSSPPRA